MKTIRSLVAHATLCMLTILLALFSISASSQEQTTAPAATEAAAPATQNLTPEELEVLVARIALYPDDLVAVVVSASLNALQIVQAARFLDDRKTKPELKVNPNWDGSVISLLNYPEIVKMMNDDLAWTEQLGAAAVNQQQELLAAIQQLRDQALASGVLKSSDKAVVEEVNENVVIRSSDPEVIYVPTYDPAILTEPAYVAPAEPVVDYSEPYCSYYYPGCGYWAGAVTGAIWAGMIDWDVGDFWGGDVDIDFDRGDIDIGDIDIDRERPDFTNIDRSKLKIDQGKLKQGLQANNRNRVTNKTQRNRVNQGVSTRTTKGQDVRKSIESGLKQKPGAAQRPATAQRKPSQKAKQAGAQRPATKKAAKPKKSKMASRPDTRSRGPSVTGDYGRGKSAKAASHRGSSSVSKMRRPPQYASRGGGGRGGGGRGGGGRGGGGGGGRGGGGRR